MDIKRGGWTLKPRHLELLDSLGTHHNLRRAAAAIGMQQPAASRLLKDLEEVLDVRLFTRTSHGMVPTPIGQFLIERAEASLGQLKTLPREIADFAEGRRGRVRLGIVPSILPDMLIAAVRQVTLDGPELLFSVQQANHAHLLDELKRDELDLVISRAPASAAERDIASRLLFMESYCLVHAQDGVDAADRDGLLACRWILPPEGLPLRREIDLYFLGFFGRRPDAIIEATAIEVLRALLVQMPCIAAMPRSLLGSDHGIGTLRELALPGLNLRVPTFLLTGPESTHRPAIRIFLDALQEAPLATQVDR